MAARIDTVAPREKLKPRREPYWQRVRKGCFVGYRKMTTGATVSGLRALATKKPARSRFSSRWASSVSWQTTFASMLLGQLDQRQVAFVQIAHDEHEGGVGAPARAWRSSAIEWMTRI
jgi:hypothetical protein